MGVKHVVCTRPGAKRPNYFAGRLLTAEDLQREQDYHLDKLRQLVRTILGVGIVDGLKVSSAGPKVTVSPGVAMDPTGRLIELPESCQFDLPAGGGAWNCLHRAGGSWVRPAPRYGGRRGDRRRTELRHASGSYEAVD